MRHQEVSFSPIPVTLTLKEDDFCLVGMLWVKGYYMLMFCFFFLL